MHESMVSRELAGVCMLRWGHFLVSSEILGPYGAPFGFNMLHDRCLIRLLSSAVLLAPLRFISPHGGFEDIDGAISGEFAHSRFC